MNVIFQYEANPIVPPQPGPGQCRCVICGEMFPAPVEWAGGMDVCFQCDPSRVDMFMGASHQLPATVG